MAKVKGLAEDEIARDVNTLALVAQSIARNPFILDAEESLRADCERILEAIERAHQAQAVAA